MSERTDGNAVAGKDGHGGERLALRQVVGHATHAWVVVVFGEGAEETDILYFVSEQFRQEADLLTAHWLVRAFSVLASAFTSPLCQLKALTV